MMEGPSVWYGLCIYASRWCRLLHCVYVDLMHALFNIVIGGDRILVVSKQGWETVVQPGTQPASNLSKPCAGSSQRPAHRESSHSLVLDQMQRGLVISNHAPKSHTLLRFQLQQLPYYVAPRITDQHHFGVEQPHGDVNETKSFTPSMAMCTSSHICLDPLTYAGFAPAE